jgi:hypothetical protein
MMDIEKLKQHLETIRFCEYEAGMCDDDGTMEEESEQKKALALTCSNEITREWEAMEKRIAELEQQVERLSPRPVNITGSGIVLGEADGR